MFQILHHPSVAQRVGFSRIKIMANEADIIKLFIGLGLSEQKAKETYKNATVTATLVTILNEVRLCFVLT